MWHGLAAPKTLPKPLKTLVREMLLLADRITAVQVSVAALPRTSLESYGGNSMGKRRSCYDPQQSLKPPANDVLPRASSLSFGQHASVAEAEQSVRYVITVLMQPLHESHTRQLQLIDAVAQAAKQSLLGPCVEAQQQLQSLAHQLEWERARSNNLVASLRKQLHHDVIHVHEAAAGTPLQPDGAEIIMHRDDSPLHQSSIFHTQHAQTLVRCLSAAMGSDGALPVVDVGESEHGVSICNEIVGGPDVGVHVSRWWWVHAGEHYCQLLAFQYSFDAVVAGMLAVIFAASVI